MGDPLPSTKLHALGLIARCVPAAELEAEAAKVIDRLAANAPLSLKAMKALTVRQLEFRDAIPHDDVDAAVRAAMQSQDAQEGMRRAGEAHAKFQGSYVRSPPPRQAWRRDAESRPPAGQLGVYQIDEPRAPSLYRQRGPRPSACERAAAPSKRVPRPAVPRRGKHIARWVELLFPQADHGPGPDNARNSRLHIEARPERKPWISNQRNSRC